MYQQTRRVLFVLGVAAMLGAAHPAAAQQADDGEAGEPAADEQKSNGESGSRAAGEGEASAANVETYSLDKLTELAVNNSALVDELEAKRAQAEWDKYKVEHAWSPEIKSTTVVAPVPDKADPDEFDENLDEFADLAIGPYIREDLDIVVPVYTFGRIDAGQQLADLGVQNADLEAQTARLDALYETKRAYYSLRLSHAFGEMLQEGKKLIDEQLADMQEAREFGEADFEIKDYRKLQIFSAELEERILDNQKLATVARAGLHFLTEIPRDTRIDVPKLDDVDSPPQVQPLDYYLARAMEMRPEVVQLDMAVKARRLESTLEKAEWYPNVFFAFRLGFGWSTEETRLQRICSVPSVDADDCDFPEDQVPLLAEPYSDPLNAFSVQVGLGLRWQVNPLQQYAEVEKKESKVMAIMAQRRRAREAIKLEVRKLYQDAADALEKMAITKRRLKAAQRWRDQMGLSRQTAGADIDDAVAPLKAFFEARAKYLEAVYNYYVARAALAQGVGAASLGEDGSALAEE